MIEKCILGREHLTAEDNSQEARSKLFKSTAINEKAAFLRSNKRRKLDIMRIRK